jgi:hypothetical protein
MAFAESGRATTLLFTVAVTFPTTLSMAAPMAYPTQGATVSMVETTAAMVMAVTAAAMGVAADVVVGAAGIDRRALRLSSTA